MNDDPVYAQFINHNIDNKTLFYGCEMYTGQFHCDPLRNKFERKEIDSASTTIYPVTRVPSYSEGKDGKALKMHANHAETIHFSNTSDTMSKEFSISFWIKGILEDPKTEFPTFGHILSAGGWSFTDYNMTTLSNEDVRFTLVNDEGKPFSPPDIRLDPVAFVHITVTFDNSSIKIYKDGTFAGQVKISGTYGHYPRVPLRISGAADSPMSFFWSGVIDDLRLYNRALTGQEIETIFRNDLTNIVAAKNLLGYWRFDGDLKDTSGNNHHGTENTLVSSMVFAPDGRLFLSEKNTGKIRVMKNDKVNAWPFASVSDYYINWEQGLLGLAIDPKFAQNHFLYLYYTSLDNKTGEPFNRLVRFTDDNNIGKNMTIILDRIGPGARGFHSGGALAFGPDDKLYITVGDGTQNVKCGSLLDSQRAICPAQDPTSLLGKVLRINRDGTIPFDNPFPNSPVYNLGHINMFGIAFDKSGFGLVSENGDVLYDEINTIEKGANYGAPDLQPFNLSPENSSNFSVKPLKTYYIARCLTQMIFFDGNKPSELKNKFIVGSLDGDIVEGHIYALSLDRNKKQIIAEEKIKLRNPLYNEAVAIAESPSGELYYGGYAVNKLQMVNYTNQKQILFPIELNYSPAAVQVKDLQLLPSKSGMVVNLYTNQSHSKDSVTLVSLKIPKNLLDVFSKVSNTIGKNQTQQASGPKILRYSIDDSSLSGYNVINIYLSLPNRRNSSIFMIASNDTIIPDVKITYPPYPLTVYSNKTIEINGTTSDSPSGVEKVEAFVHTFPFNNQWPYELAVDHSRGNWSNWSFPVAINSTGSYRISVKVTDKAGNENWAETMINIPFMEKTTSASANASTDASVSASSTKEAQPRIAFIDNTFTESAYGDQGFYAFYGKYGFPPFGKVITTDLDMLTTKIQPFLINESNSVRMSNLTALIPQDADEQKFWLPFTERVEKIATNARITVLRDQDVDDGLIFRPDGSNVYDLLILFHDEYTTQKGYDNFRRFVSNGGTMIFIDSNVFYAEVKYNRDKQTISLVKGHDWEFDGKSAKRSVEERWFNETKDWVGSNFLVTDISSKISFANNPFNYTHFEENFLNNPNAHIVLDYKIKFPKDYLNSGENKFPSGKKEGDIIVATYELNYGKGQVLVFGLYGQNLSNNEPFLNYFGNRVKQYLDAISKAAG